MLQTATQQGKHISKTKRSGGGLTLRSRGAVATRHRAFSQHWSDIVGGQPDTDLDTFISSLKRQSLEKSLGAAAEAVNIEEFLRLLSGLKKGTAGGADGVLGEFLQV